MQHQTNDSALSTPTSTTRQLPPRISRLVAAFYWLIFIAAMLYIIQIIPHETAYIQRQAEKLADTPQLIPLYYLLMFSGFHLVRIVYIGASLIIFRHKSNHRMNLFVAFFLLTFGIGANLFLVYMPNYTLYAQEHGLYWGILLFNAFGWVSFFAFLYIFPNGSLKPRWMLIGLALSYVFTFLWGLSDESPYHPNNWEPTVLALVTIPIFLMPIVSQVYRYRYRYSPIERQQSKWVIYGLILAFSGFIAASLWVVVYPHYYVLGSLEYDVFGQLGNVSINFIPISLVLAMLRFRLWEVDLIINRSLVYAVFIALILLLFFGILFASQVLLGQTQILVTLGVSLLCSAFAFMLVRHHIQHFVDHKIYGLRFDLADLAKQADKIQTTGALSGQQFGKYQILDLLGRGGMGEVYKVRLADKFFALKTLQVEKSLDAEMLSRFQREAQAGMDLKHPNIARVYDLAVHEGVPYMVMDYLEGQDLSDTLKSAGKLDTETILGIADDLLGALVAAHEQGLVHRDIKPSNVMLVPQSDKETFRAVLMDFGIAKIKDANTITGTGAIGTIDYMSPEQIMSAKTVDHRADIYALGILLYEMAVGERPFKGGAGQVLFAHIQQPAPDPRDSDEEIPRQLAKTILKALEKKPEDRFQSAAEMRAFLK